MGSNTFLIPRMSSTCSQPRLSSKNARLAWPMPCSPLTLAAIAAAPAAYSRSMTVFDGIHATAASATSVLTHVNVQVAVTRVSEGTDAHLHFSADLHAAACTKAGNPIPGHHHVAFVHAWRAPLDRLQKRAARVPDALLALVRIRQQHVPRTQAPAPDRSAVSTMQGRSASVAGPVQPHQQICVRAGVGELLAQIRFRAGDDLPLHKLHGRRLAAAAPAPPAPPRCTPPDASKGISSAHVGLGLRNQLHRQLGQDAQRSLAAHHQVDQAVSAGGFHVLPAQT